MKEAIKMRTLSIITAIALIVIFAAKGYGEKNVMDENLKFENEWCENIFSEVFPSLVAMNREYREDPYIQKAMKSLKKSHE